MKEYVCHKCGEVPKATIYKGELILACNCETVLKIASAESPSLPDNWSPRVDES